MYYFKRFDKHNTSPLTNDQLRALCPSAFAQNPSETTSKIYTFIPTINVIEGLKNEGWEPVWASEVNTRKPSKKGFQKHIVRFQHRSLKGKSLRDAKGNLVELVLTNAHDATSAYQLHAGVFRMVCSNGLILADETFASTRVRHVKSQMDDVLEASYRILEETPVIENSITGMLSTELSPEEKKIFAESAMLLKWDNTEVCPIDSDKLLRPRRREDQKSDLYTTFNVIQENLIRGGIRGINEKRNRVRTREVKSINENLRLNKALWKLSEEMKKLKGVA